MSTESFFDVKFDDPFTESKSFDQGFDNFDSDFSKLSLKGSNSSDVFSETDNNFAFNKKFEQYDNADQRPNMERSNSQV